MGLIMHLGIISYLRNLRASSRPKWAMLPVSNATLQFETTLLAVSILERCGVIYTMHHGNLLGLTRLQGFAPWDIDSDLFFFNAAGTTFKDRVVETLKDHGLLLQERIAGGYFVIRPAVFMTGMTIPLFPFVESSFLYEDRNSRGEAVFNQYDPLRKWDAGELLPLRRYPFYSTWLNGPNNPEPVIERLYHGAGSPSAMARFERPTVHQSSEEFWRRSRPIAGELDWPAISQRGKQLHRTIVWRCLRCAPWYLLNSAYSILVEKVRRLAGGPTW